MTTLATGARLGAYEIIAPLGAGGMGEVYRAADTTLKRQVALKVLPASVANDPERLARFRREAEVLASLNHPNIAQIYGLQEGPPDAGVSPAKARHDVLALVMELVDGPTLADRIALGPLPADEALAIARQIVEALETAHEQGIVHRDLKPANVKVRPDGTVKVLDFGLAKVMGVPDQGAAGNAGGSGTGGRRAGQQPDLAPTITSPAMATAAGVLLGTAAYMSPEQARGRPVDKRADIWAFGCVLFEMVTGRRAFAGDDVTETIAAIVRDQPDLRLAPSHLRQLLERCLEKDPRRRLRDIGDALALVAPDAGDTGRPRAGRPWLAIAGWAAAGVLLVALALVMLREPVRDSETMPVVRFQIERPADVYNRTATAFAVSPNGLLLAYYVATPDGPLVLAVRTLATGELREVPGSATPAPLPNSLFWSADSRHLVRGTASGAQVFEISTGAVRTLCECRYIGGSWNQDGTVLLGGLGVGNGISRLSPGQTRPDAMTMPDASLAEHDEWPLFLPDGRRYLFTRRSADGGAATYVGTLDGGTSMRIFDGSARAIVPRVGGLGAHLLAIDGSGVVALPFDVEAARPTGAATTLIAGAAAASASQSGVLATSVAGSRPRTVPTWFDRSGASRGTIGQPAFIEGIALSPDGRKLARSESPASGGAAAVWLEDLTSGARTRLTFDRSGSAPVWSPASTRLAFTSNRNGINLPYQRAADGTGMETPLFAYDWHAWINDWSRDGRWLLFSSPSRVGIGNDLWVLPAGTTDGKAVPYVSGPGIQQQAQFSPDGRFVAYGSDQSGTWELYVQTFPNAADGKWMVASGGTEPRWSPDGNELFYFSGQTLMSVPVRLRPTFSTGTPVKLFDAAILASYFADSHRWLVAPDGRRFLLLVDTGSAQGPPIEVVVGWPGLLSR